LQDKRLEAPFSVRLPEIIWIRHVGTAKSYSYRKRQASTYRMLYPQFGRLFGHAAETGNRNSHYCITVKISYNIY